MIGALDTAYFASVRNCIGGTTSAPRMRLRMADGHIVRSAAHWDGWMEIAGLRINASCEIFDSNGSWSVLIGKPIQQQLGAIHDYGRDVVTISVGGEPVILRNESKILNAREALGGSGTCAQPPARQAEPVLLSGSVDDSFLGKPTTVGDIHEPPMPEEPRKVSGGLNSARHPPRGESIHFFHEDNDIAKVEAVVVEDSWPFAGRRGREDDLELWMAWKIYMLSARNRAQPLWGCLRLRTPPRGEYQNHLQSRSLLTMPMYILQASLRVLLLWRSTVLMPENCAQPQRGWIHL
ncbi:hypothetical protein C8F01DRAFT_330141 [Mycena amicta]|nr:hypothetical protein C8F01DRAFT_330141 [Mycena amicta]